MGTNSHFQTSVSLFTHAVASWLERNSPDGVTHTIIMFWNITCTDIKQDMGLHIPDTNIFLLLATYCVKNELVLGDFIQVLTMLRLF
jgi:hypothetical protein